ncbi:plasmid-related protein [Emticicia oligotrophica DSM 17448]|uniref:Plasmid-related protein n=1 Tax=Emticicia oligotrophica (strain DSM 17448 / CIP 109782 / MTCC 6937 / GPTSA100-15) TaxID=929562 RepID=A0ABN4AJ33_EMTOG|nr:aminoglycoside 6-adenylyltransferase [Emticicia oligotrophica]AFK02048.1 plasmid-related protein [Emticicia oligotrophica DSM 17448]
MQITFEMNIQQAFAQNCIEVLKDDSSIIGLAAAGSWITNEIDQFSDLDLVLVTKEKITHDKNLMLTYAKRLGHFLSGFTGEHVGEPRVLICLYDSPLLHVDIKFVTLEEFAYRIENPVILLDTDNQLQKIIEHTHYNFPYPDYQWIEDRFWIWVHYALLKIGRGELTEALDFMGFMRMVVLGPLLHIKNENLPRGVRKVETQITKNDFADLKATIPSYDRKSLLESLSKAIEIYRNLRVQLFSSEIQFQQETELRVMQYFEEIKQMNDH